MGRIARVIGAFQDKASLESARPFWDGFRVGVAAPSSLFAWVPLDAPGIEEIDLAQVWGDVGDLLADSAQEIKSGGR